MNCMAVGLMCKERLYIWFVQAVELLEKCWNLKCLFKGTGSSLKMGLFLEA